MRFALLLLWLTILAPAAHAADWLTWRRVGEATLTWGPFTVYHSQLRTPNGRYDGPQQDRALFHHHLPARHRSRHTGAGGGHRDQWQAPRRAFCSRNPAPSQLAWLRVHAALGSGRTSRRAASWRSWSAAARGSSGTAPAPRRPPLPRSARASRRRSAPAFSPSGSIRAPLIPNCVSS